MKRNAGLLFFICCFLYYILLFMRIEIYTEAVNAVLLLFVLYFGYKAFFYKEKKAFFKVSGLFFCLGIIFRIGISLSWEVSLIDKVELYKISNGYLLLFVYILTNLCLIISLSIYGYLETRHWNRMQFFLDIAVLSMSLLFCVWILLYEHNKYFIEKMQSDILLVICLILDVILLTWNFIWICSTKKGLLQLPMLFIAIGSSIYVCSDFLYYYMFVENAAEKTMFTDFFGTAGFILMGSGAFLKLKLKNRHFGVKNLNNISRFWKDILIIAIPCIALVIEHKKPITSSTVSLILILFLYFIFSEYIQSNKQKDEKLKLERLNVSYLEQKVDERTSELLWMNNTDAITGLYNRRYFEEYLKEMCENSESTKECLTLFYIEVNKQNNFRSFYERDTSETIMKQITQILKTLTDINIQLLAAYGESTFVIASKQLCSFSVELEYAQKIIRHCSKSYQVNSHDIAVSLNIGISCFPTQANTYEELLTNAELALIQSKEEGMNHVVVYNEKIGYYLNQKNQLEMMLRHSNFSEEFKLFYQPQVEAENGKLVGFEALIRWFSKSKGMISPLEFIPEAEETGTIVPLGYYIMEEAARQLSNWKKITDKKITMAVNVSSKQLMDTEFAIKLSDILKKYKIDPDEFEIEITENISLGDNETVHETISYIELMGVPIAIDDFGTGYSSLIYLKNLQIHRIKIAKELIDNIENDSYDRTIVKMVVLIAKEKKIRVIAEGVETKVQWECLKEIGCDEIQGYYFSKPMPPDEIEKVWLQNAEIATGI